ncbi:MAG: hypothetical protein MK098_10780 [Marinovum sp.]|nr:hypothetical protein [Marinovum sp.]
MKWLVSFLVTLCLVSQANAGAWPRGHGKTFTSASGELWQDEQGYLHYYTSAYLEYGRTPKLSIGTITAMGSLSGADNEIFAGYTVWQKGPHVLSLETALHENRTLDFAGQEQVSPGYGVGLSYGRGFQLAQRNGWITLDARLNRSTKLQEFKFDTTLGLSLHERWKVMTQVFTSTIDGETNIKFAPGVVFSVNEKTHIELGARVPSRDAERAAIKLGLWREF